MSINHSEMTALFTDYDDNHTPYDGIALRVVLVADVLVLDVGRLVEGRDNAMFKRDDEHSIGVDAGELYETLGVMLRRSDRRTRDLLNAGEIESDHPLREDVVASVALPGVRRRA